LSAIDECDKKGSGRIVHTQISMRGYGDQPALAPRKSDAKETIPRTENQMAPGPSEKLRLQTNPSKLKLSN
jgi:hypothetical protein